MPRASATEAIVLAVNMPAHEPSVGQAFVLDEGELLVAQGVDGVGPDRFEDTDDVEGTVAQTARQDAAAVEEDARQVEAGRRHEHPRKGLVAAGEGHEGVEALGMP